MADVTPLGPLLTAHLFPTLETRLVDLLRSLRPDDWERQTIAPRWKVKDVAAHLLDTQSASDNWFDIARELTERWHHQQQIRLAVGADLRAIMTPELYHPVLDCFMRALPFHYRSAAAPPGSAIRVHVTGDCGGEWHLFRGDSWVLSGEPAGVVVATVTIPQDIAWRIFTKGISRTEAIEQVSVSGDAALGRHILDMLTIVG